MIDQSTARGALLDLDRELVARGGLREFARLTWPLVEPGQLLWNWHLDVICEHLEAVTRGEIKNLLFCVPPGTMKSLLVSSMWPAWEWVGSPATKWIYSTYSQSLSDKNAKHHRDIVKSDFYRDRWGDRCAIVRDSVKQVRFFENQAHGFRYSTAVGAGVTGRHANRLVFDDLVKAQDAEGRAAINLGAIERANDFWFGTMSTRQADPKTTSRVGIMQRLHQRDTAALCIESGGYTVVTLPMEYDPRRRACFSIPVPTESLGVIEEDPRETAGELLWPERYPKPEVDELRVSLGPLGAAAQLDQDPTPPGGAVFKAEDLQRRWRLIPAGARYIITVDCSFEDEQTAVDPDYVVMQCWAAHGSDFYLVDQVRRKLDVVGTVDALLGFSRKHKAATAIWVEKKANGAAVIRMLRDQVAGVKAWPPRGEPMPSKIERANAVQPLCGHILLPEGEAWTLDYVAELVGFPRAKHDDQVDATTMALLLLHRRQHRRYGDALGRIASKG